MTSEPLHFVVSLARPLHLIQRGVLEFGHLMDTLPDSLLSGGFVNTVPDH